MHVFDDAEIARITGGRLIWPGAPGPIEADRRKPLTGCWFVALAGDGFDDHAFVGEVVAQGAAGVIVERPVAADAGVVCVDDTWRALRDMARFARERFAGPVVGITGSCGKTTTRQMTALALSPLGVVNENPGSSNAEPGVALTLLNAPADAVAQVVEVGLGRPDGVALLVDVVRPDVRVITNVGPAHLDVAGSVAGVARQKAPMFTTAQAGDVCVGATDDAAVAAMVRPAGVRREDVGASGRFRLLSAAPVDDLAVHARWATPEGEVEARLSTP
nr:hypothetical protein [Myxococcales bacterium]